ncbi:hypothetical protein Godav_023742 [Gossypium davidsonii]|uniref:Secreted protein n=2 Tax=Gossypium TaxID=3633 RepID=A0A7J8STI8_GOSDV|nr:hypothetical protein [Gossypium davidsonii]MBA0664827.1 hypothetical protein [Gossypium klotzschianum]
MIKKRRYLFQRRIKHVLFQRVALALLLKLIRSALDVTEVEGGGPFWKDVISCFTALRRARSSYSIRRSTKRNRLLPLL